MANGGNIRYSVDFNVNKSGLNDLKASLQAIQQQAAKVSGTDKMTKELQESAQAAQKLEKILDSAWNSKLQQFNLNKVNESIKTTYGNVNNLKSSLEKSGSVGASAYNQVASALLTTNMQLKQSNKLLDSMAISMANTVKWGISSSIFNSMTSSIQKAWSYTKNLDSSLNDIRIVTGESAEKMEQFAINANKAAKQLGSSTLDYTEASLIYYQQGLSEEDVAARAETTLKAANVTGQTGEEVSEQLTAVWNGYKVSAEEAELYVDKLAAVAATTASDLEELSVGMSKVASAASLMGVDIDQLNATLATVVSVTRQAPESVGTAFKTIYARMGDIEAGLDTETTLGDYTEKMKEIAGINVLDANNELREMGEVVEEVGNKWGTMSREQQIALSQVMAGTRQYNNLLSLFDNWDMYTEALNTSANAAGTLQEQQDTYMESTAAHLQQLRTETQRTYDLMFNTESINGVIDVFDGGLEAFNNFIEGIDGGGNALLLFGSIAANIFDKQIAGSLLRLQNNLQVLKIQLKDTVDTLRGKEGAGDAKKQWIETQAAAQVNMNNAISGTPVGDAGLKAQQQAASEILKVQKGLTQEQYQQSLELNKQIGLTAETLANKEQSKTLTEKEVEALKILKVTQESSTATIKERKFAEEENLNTLEKGKEALIDIAAEMDRLTQKQTTRSLATAEILTKEQQVKNALGQTGMSSINIERTWKGIVNAFKEGTLSTESLQALLNLIEGQEKEINTAIAAGNILLNQRDPELINDIELLKQQLGLYQQQNGEIVKQGAANLKMQKVVNVGMAAVGVISSMTGAMSAFTDETATGEQKAHALGSAFSGVAMAVGSAFGPVGMVVGGVIGALGSLVSQLDIVEDAFKSTEEKMEELHEKQQELISQAKEFQSAKASLQEVAEEYDQLAQKAGEYDSNIDNLTDSERARYNELKNTILEYNSEALLAYSSEGEAILKKNENIQTTIDLLKEQYELEAKTKFEENWKDINDTREDTLSDAKEKVKSRKEDLDYAKSDEAIAQADEIAKQSFDSIISLMSENSNYLIEATVEEQQQVKDSITKLNNAFYDKTLKAEDVDAFIEEISKIEGTESIVSNAEGIKYWLTYSQDQIKIAEDALVQAKIEAEAAQQLDTGFIANTVKYIEDYNSGWEKLSTLDIDNLDTYLNQFVDTLEYGVNGIKSYDDAYNTANNYMETLYTVLSQVSDPSAWLSDTTLDAYSFDTVYDYNQATIDKINDLVDSNIEIFKQLTDDQKEAFFALMFGLTNVNFENGAATSVNTGYKQKRKDVVSNWVGDIGGIQYEDESGKVNPLEGESLNNFIDNELTFLGPEEIDNFETIVSLIDESVLKAYGLEGALKLAAEAWKEQQEQEQESPEIAKINEEAETQGLETEDIDEYAEHLQEVAKESELVSDELEENEVAAQLVAKATARMNKGVETLSDNYEDWADVLKKSDKASQEYSEAMNDMKDAVADVLDMDTGWLSNDFIEKNLDNIAKASQGSAEAIEELKVAAAQDVVMQISAGLDTTTQEKLQTQVAELARDLNIPEIKVGATLDDGDFLNKAQEIINTAGMTVEEANATFSAMGFQAKFKTEEQPVEQRNPITITTTEIIGYEGGEAPGPDGEMRKWEYPILKTYSYNDGYETQTGMVDAIAMATSPDGSKVPQIESLTKKSSGSLNNSSSRNTGGKKGSGSGGGKGSGSKAKKEKKVETKKDRYHDVNVRLEQIDEDLEDVGRKQEKLFGKDLIDALEEELDILEQQRDVLNEKLLIAKDEQAELQKSLKAEGVQFNEDGTIKNYMAIMTAKENALNAMIDKYNSMSAADQEKYQETLDNAKEEYENFVEMLGNYDDLLLETIPEIENTIQDITDREIEIQIQKLNMEVELRLDMTEAQKEWNEFKREVIDGVDSDDIFGNALADADLFSEILQNGTMEALTNNINNTMDQIKSINETGTSSIFGDDKQAALDNLDEQMSNLMDHMSELTDLQKQISEAYLDMIDEVGEAFDEQVESYEYVGDLINHNMNMIKLINGDDAYTEMAQLYKEQKENNLSIMQSQKAAVDYYRQMMETETDPEAIEKWTELWKGAVEDLNSTVESSVEWIIEEYGNAINAIFDELDDKMTNGKGLDYLTQEWELKNENADQYLDTINSTYEIQKLERKIQDSINNTDSLSAQKKLNDFMDEELEMLREKEKLTQYDVDRANALYEVKLKEIALEEAQQNKSQMRLRRDASGNYSYQFVADQDSISQAQQELDDARNSLYNMDKDEYRENQQAILDVYTEFQEKMREAANLSAEEKELIEQQYNERINALLEENGYIRTNLMESAFADLAALYGSDVANFQQMNMEEQDILMGQIVPNWDSGIQSMIDTMTNPETGFGPMCKLAMEELDLATQEYNESLATIEQTAGVSFEAMQTGYDTNIELAQQLADAQQENINRTIEEKDAIGKLKLEVDNLVNSYKDAYQAAKDALEAAQNLRNYEAEQAAKEAAKNNPGGSGGSGSGDGKDGGSGSGGKTKLTNEIIDGVAGAIWYWSPSAWGNGNERKQKIESKFGSGAYNTIQSYINDHVTTSGKMKKAFNYGWGERNKYKNYYYSKFDTGGYTGDWPGSDGRMAMLHKKELVLNADDTKNFLSAINLVRDMESMLAAMNDSMLSRTSGMTASLAPSLGFDDAASNTVNQNVSIQASFPGVSSRAEIEEAFQNLVNIASQHAFNTQR